MMDKSSGVYELCTPTFSSMIDLHTFVSTRGQQGLQTGDYGQSGRYVVALMFHVATWRANWFGPRLTLAFSLLCLIGM